MAEPPKRPARRYVEDGGRRLQALRVLMGDGTPTAFAARIQIAGLGASTLRNIEAGYRDRGLWDYEAAAIAVACGVPPSFFTAPLEHLGDMRSSQ